MTTDSKFNAHARDREKYPFGYPVSPLVTRKEVNFPPESRIPDLVDLDQVTVWS